MQESTVQDTLLQYMQKSTCFLTVLSTKKYGSFELLPTNAATICDFVYTIGISCSQKCRRRYPTHKWRDSRTNSRQSLKIQNRYDPLLR